MVVSRVRRGCVSFMLTSVASFLGYSFLPQKVMRKCANPNSRKISEPAIHKYAAIISFRLVLFQSGCVLFHIGKLFPEQISFIPRRSCFLLGNLIANQKTQLHIFLSCFKIEVGFCKLVLW